MENVSQVKLPLSIKIALLDTRLKPIDFRIYLYLSTLKSAEGLRNEHIKKRLGIGGRTTLSRSWKRLIEYGYIRRDRVDKGSAYNYTLVLKSN